MAGTRCKRWVNLTGGVQFLTLKAKGKLSYPETVWSVADFQRHFAKARELRRKFDEILSKLEIRRMANSGLSIDGRRSRRRQWLADGHRLGEPSLSWRCARGKILGSTPARVIYLAAGRSGDQWRLI